MYDRLPRLSIDRRPFQLVPVSLPRGNTYERAIAMRINIQRFNVEYVICYDNLLLTNTDCYLLVRMLPFVLSRPLAKWMVLSVAALVVWFLMYCRSFQNIICKCEQIIRYTNPYILDVIRIANSYIHLCHFTFYTYRVCSYRLLIRSLRLSRRSYSLEI